MNTGLQNLKLPTLLQVSFPAGEDVIGPSVVKLNASKHHLLRALKNAFDVRIDG